MDGQEINVILTNWSNIKCCHFFPPRYISRDLFSVILEVSKNIKYKIFLESECYWTFLTTVENFIMSFLLKPLYYQSLSWIDVFPLIIRASHFCVYNDLT